MEFDWQTPPFDPGVIGVMDIEETFSLKFLPEEGRSARFYQLGRSLGDKRPRALIFTHKCEGESQRDSIL